MKTTIHKLCNNLSAEKRNVARTNGSWFNPNSNCFGICEKEDTLGSRGPRQVKNVKQWLRGELGSQYNDAQWTVLPFEILDCTFCGSYHHESPMT
jgi:hypothetical protein